MQGCYENFLDRAPRGAHREFCGQSFWFAASLSDTFAAAFAYSDSRSLYPFAEPIMICTVEEVLSISSLSLLIATAEARSLLPVRPSSGSYA